MELTDIEAELADDDPAVREAAKRGLLAAYDNWDEVEGEYSGHVRGIIAAVRAAMQPLIGANQPCLCKCEACAHCVAVWP